MKNTYGYNIGFTGLLTLIFITLKLTNVIDWSWLWVLAPIWIAWSLVLVLLIVYCVLFVFVRTKK